MNSSGRLTNLRIGLLKIFNYDLAESQLEDIKNMLGKYFAETAWTEMDKLWERERLSNETMEQCANEHLRKKVKFSKGPDYSHVIVIDSAKADK